MRKVTSTQMLFVVLGVLLLIFGLHQFFGRDKNRSGDFQRAIESFDAGKVTRIYVTKPLEDIRLEKEGTSWNAVLENGRVVDARPDKVLETLELLNKVKFDQLFSRERDDWFKYKVDSTGTRVEAYAKDEKVIDIILGATEFSGNSTFTYLRRPSDDKTYALQNVFVYDLFESVSSYRKNTLFDFLRDSVYSISLKSEGLSYALEYDDGDVWMMGADSVSEGKVEDYLSSMGTLTSSSYEDDFTPKKSPNETLTIKEKGGKVTTVKSYKIDSATWILNSSFNEMSFFKDATLREDIFKDRSFFLAPGNLLE